jgi:hypothetical protein
MSMPNPQTRLPPSLDMLDRAAVAYLTLPLLIFLFGWFEIWAAIPLAACVGYAIRRLFGALPAATRWPITPLQLGVAVSIGCAWTVLGGTDHLVYANTDWYIRDAVLHDLVVSPWPVGYGTVDGHETLLRAPLGYYMPAALVGKLAGLPVAHLCMALWTAIGASLFLIQVLSLLPARAGMIAMSMAVVVLFSGFDILGNLLDVPRFIAHWNIAEHLEWWAGSYQYSSMTTQMFWVPNHALGGWLAIGLLFRNQGELRLDFTLPIVVVAVALWSPLTALGLVPFVVWYAIASMRRERSLMLFDPRVWAPALIVGMAVAAYLTLDAGTIKKGLNLGDNGAAAVASALLRHAQFFLLEAGFIGYAILAIRRSNQVILALVILALLPLFSFGPANDLVMRASIPSLTVLAIGACIALSQPAPDRRALRKRWVLAGMLTVGAVTPIQEFARAVVLPAWPINMNATLIGASCGRFPGHYVARVSDQVIVRILRRPYPLSIAPEPQACDNPAYDLMYRRGLL